MNRRRLVDTNLIIRFLVGDHEKHAKAASKLFAACDAGDLTLVLLPEIFNECVFVLESFYKHPRAKIAEVLGELLSSPGVELSQLAVHLDALSRYRDGRAHFVDCTIASTAADLGLPIATFDADFKKFADVAVDVE